MKKLLISFGMLLIGLCAKAQSDCSAYHKGYFMYTDSAGITYLIHRKKKYQYQYSSNREVMTQFELSWINDCEYVITQRITNSRSLRKYRNRVTKVVISRSDGENGYYYTCSCIDDSLRQKENFLKKITREEFFNYKP